MSGSAGSGMAGNGAPEDRGIGAAAVGTGTGAGTGAVLRIEGLGVSLPGHGMMPGRDDRRDDRRGGGRVRVLEALDLAVMPGETTALVGESGSGKTVAALAAMRLLPAGAETEGRVWFEGTDLLRADARRMRALRGRLGMVFQNPLAALNPSMTVGAQVAEGMRLHGGFGRRAARARAAELLGEVGIPDPARRLDDHPHQFSGGQRQRVTIAAALATEPAVLIADEPTSGLDPLVAQQILLLLDRLRATHRLGVLLITHDLGVVERHADRLCVLYAGRAVEWGSADRFFAGPRHPYGAALLGAVPRIGQRELRGIPGTLPDPARRPAGCRFLPRCDRGREPCGRNYPPPVGDAAAAACCLFPIEAAGVEGRDGEDRMGGTDAPPALPAVPAAVPLLAMRDVGVRYGERAPPSLGAVSLALNRGECLGIVGESGSGKTTLGRAMLMMLRYAGSITLDGEELGALRGPALRRARRRVQPVFQDPRESLNPRIRIGSALAEPLRLGGLRDRDRIGREVAALLNKVGLDPALAERLPGQVSGGQAQRVAIARALASRPEIMVLDEPFSALDVSTQAVLLNMLRELGRSERVAIVLVSHDIAAVGWIADRVAVLREGRIVEVGAAERVLGAPEHPYSAALVGTAPRAHAVVGTGAAG